MSFQTTTVMVGLIASAKSATFTSVQHQATLNQRKKARFRWLGVSYTPTGGRIENKQAFTKSCTILENLLRMIH